MLSFYKDKTVLVTGAAGTVGRELARQLKFFGAGELRLMDNNETEIFFLMEEYNGKGAHCFLGDIRDEGKLFELADGADIIIHSAAFKHVVLSEYNAYDIVQTNIMGVQNVIRAANRADVGHVLFTSSDKAVNPTNVMGTSKLMGERLITAANTTVRDHRTVFSSTRFGNVIGSRGSVVPIFARQILSGGPVTLTDERMTRFIMTIGEAARLVLSSLAVARGGEVFVTKMPVVRIIDLAGAMIEILAPAAGRKPPDIEIKVIGAKPGEKLYEELMSEEEVHRAQELKDMFVVIPAFKSIYGGIDYSYDGVVRERPERAYISSTERPMSKEEITAYLREHRLLDAFAGGSV